MVFQHDGAPAHYSRLVTHHLNLTFPERWIGHGGHVQWPPRSLDRIPLRVLSVGMDEKGSLQRKSKQDKNYRNNVTSNTTIHEEF
jgi:hypothetical protein